MEKTNFNLLFTNFAINTEVFLVSQPAAIARLETVTEKVISFSNLNDERKGRKYDY